LPTLSWKPAVKTSVAVVVVVVIVVIVVYLVHLGVGTRSKIVTRDPIITIIVTRCRWEAATICPHPCDLDLLTLKMVSESHVTWATSVPILVFLGLSVLNLGPMYATDRQTDRRQAASLLNAPA